MYVCMYVCMYVLCMYIGMYVYIYIKKILLGGKDHLIIKDDFYFD